MRPVALLILLTVLGMPASSAEAVLVYEQGPPPGNALPEDAEIVVARNDGSRPRVIAHGIYALVSPTGREVLVASRPPGAGSIGLRVVGVDGRYSRVLTRNSVAAPGAPPSANPRWSPNGRYLVANHFDSSEEYLFDLVRMRRRSTGLFFIGGASFAPSSDQIAFEADDTRTSNVFISDLRGHLTYALGGDARYPLWSSGGFAFERPGSGIEVSARPGAPARAVVRDVPRQVDYPVDWSRGGRELLTAQGPGPTLQARVLTPKDHRSVTLGPTFSEVDGLSRDGTAVLGVIDNNVVRVTLGGSVRILAHGAESASWTR